MRNGYAGAFTLCDVVNGGDFGVWCVVECEGLSLELVADCAGRGLEESLGVVGRRPLIVDVGMGLEQGLNE